MSDQIVPSEKNIHFISKGTGRPVILLHGFGASHHDWINMISELSRQGFRGLAPDLLGHGNSDKPAEPEAYTFERLYRSLEDWIASIEFDEPIILVGHSMGGHLALQYAFNHIDKVRSLVLIDPYYEAKQLSPLMRFVNQNPGLGMKALQAAPGWLIESLVDLDLFRSDHYEPHIRRQIAEDYKRASPNILRFAATIPDFNHQLEKITVPVLVIWGMKDLTLAPGSFQRLVQVLPNAFGQAIPDCGHQPHLAKPDFVNQLVLDFLQGGEVKAHTDSRREL
jgi:pimeloyl-ACP methyl ester carboxylesterase